MLAKYLWQRFFIQGKVRPLDRFTWDMNWGGNFNDPEPHYDFYFFDKEEGIVGEIGGGLSPLRDTFYVFRIEISPKPLRHQYALSMLVNISQRYGVPITPMPQIDKKMLAEVRRTSCGQLQLNEQLSIHKMEEEKLKWRHLSDAINRQKKHDIRAQVDAQLAATAAIIAAKKTQPHATR